MQKSVTLSLYLFFYHNIFNLNFDCIASVMCNAKLNKSKYRYDFYFRETFFCINRIIVLYNKINVRVLY